MSNILKALSTSFKKTNYQNLATLFLSHKYLSAWKYTQIENKELRRFLSSLSASKAKYQ